ncbi:MAG TPA: cytochrome c oxidase subunit II [Jiangellaceae bacterium]|nr:cytochrome c oxidase subunit II [Jiangellaceae bacterium]
MEGRLVGLYRSDRPARRRVTTALALGAATLLLSGCSAEIVDQWRRGGFPEPATEQTHLIGDLWNGTWIAALAIGVLVWGLILWASFAYRRRNDDIPPQTRYNLPIEFLYTVAPLAVIGALFYFTVDHQNEILDTSSEPDLTVGVVGQQWAWTFNYLDENVYEVGTTTDPATLYLPVDQTVQFELASPDTVHSFWVPSFYMKMDAIPGRTNVFQVTPNREGSFTGKCAELCGVYHSRMLFTVEVVSQDEYEDHLEGLRDADQTGEVEAPLRGSYSTTPLDQPGSDQ